MKIKLFSLGLVVSFLGVMSAPVISYADGPSITVSSNVTTVEAGGNLVVAVYMDGGGQPINAVEANLTYPASELSYVGLNYSGSPFSISTPGDGGGNGSVSIQNGTISPVSGSALIATVTFRALVSSGSADISVSSSSQLISATTNTGISFSPGGTSVKFGAVVSHSSAPSTPAAPAPSSPALPPTVISDIKAIDVTATSATITWATNNPADSVVDFGLNPSYGLSGSSSAMTTSHSVELNSAFLLPEALLHYKVQSTDAAGNVVSGQDKTLNLPGVPITIIVYAPNGSPQPNALVTIDSATGTTNSKGAVTLKTSYGNKSVSTNYQGVTVSKPIAVTPKTKPLTTYQLDLAKQPLNHWMITSIGLVVVILALIGIDGALFGSKILTKILRIKKRKLAPAPVVNVADVSDSTESAVEPILPDTDQSKQIVGSENTKSYSVNQPDVSQSFDELLNDVIDDPIDAAVPSPASFEGPRSLSSSSHGSGPRHEPIRIKIIDEDDDQIKPKKRLKSKKIKKS